MESNDYTLEDTVFRPTNKLWKCPKCGIELLTREVIIGHKKSCTGKLAVKQKSTLEEQRRKLQDKALKEFKKSHGIR